MSDFFRDKRIVFVGIVSICIVFITGIFTYGVFNLYSRSELKTVESIETNFPNYAKMRKEVATEIVESQKETLVTILPFLIPLYAITVLLILYIVTYFSTRHTTLFIQSLEESLHDDHIKTLTYTGPITRYGSIAQNYNTKVLAVNQARKENNEYLQNIGHELKTPLTALTTELDVLHLQKKPTLENLQHFAQVTEILTKRLTNLVGTLLLMSKEKEEIISYEKQNLVGIVQKVINELTVKADQTNVALVFNYSFDSIEIKGDAKYIHLVISNLIDNAIKYSKEASKVHIELTKTNNIPLLQISDTGAGIPENELTHIFEKFYRATNIREERIEGSGLGLSLVKKIADTYSWEISIDSELNTGTTIKLLFTQET